MESLTVGLKCLIVIQVRVSDSAGFRIVTTLILLLNQDSRNDSPVPEG